MWFASRLTEMKGLFAQRFQKVSGDCIKFRTIVHDLDLRTLFVPERQPALLKDENFSSPINAISDCTLISLHTTDNN
jgi:hypothetical protein